jgi:hypothetical protein
MIPLGKKKLENSIRTTIRIPSRFFSKKPPLLNISEFIRLSVDDNLFLSDLLNKMIQIFIEAGVKSDTIKFDDKEYDYIMKKIEELNKK